MTEPTGRLRQVISKLDKLGKDSSRQQISSSMATTSRMLISMGFETSADPYGNAWARLKLRSGQPLRDTGRLGSTAAWEIEAQPARFSVTNRLIYAGVQNFGATITPKRAKALRFSARGSDRAFYAQRVTIPARPMVPARGLPPEWARHLESTAKLALKLQIDAA